jgi:hypothetical protein
VYPARRDRTTVWDDRGPALRGARLRAAVGAEIEGAQAWPEGRPARVMVTNLDHVRWIRTLVGLKLGT